MKSKMIIAEEISFSISVSEMRKLSVEMRLRPSKCGPERAIKIELIFSVFFSGMDIASEQRRADGRACVSVCVVTATICSNQSFSRLISRGWIESIRNTNNNPAVPQNQRKEDANNNRIYRLDDREMSVGKP